MKIKVFVFCLLVFCQQCAARSIVTMNVGCANCGAQSYDLSLQIAKWIHSKTPDIIALQELSIGSEYEANYIRWFRSRYNYCRGVKCDWQGISTPIWIKKDLNFE